MHVEPTFPFGRPQNVQGANPVWINARAQGEQHFQTEWVHHQNLGIVSEIYKRDMHIYVFLMNAILVAYMDNAIPTQSKTV